MGGGGCRRGGGGGGEPQKPESTDHCWPVRELTNRVSAGVSGTRNAYTTKTLLPNDDTSETQLSREALKTPKIIHYCLC